ncbi:hypothetical protein N8J89_40700 [Crossiella sp. CA-258035]|uniref:hypothetical protein n=1 Tax=Crossiella sp. CA-258035 TaxID=2981138 RepID=UPI0024BC5765|nr:hypothetical protein [Crossiella sp. CA-258035]WHT19337.1 hypothetical protein N8J89_40700 [Crossiella sp. CA-258035]
MHTKTALAAVTLAAGALVLSAPLASAGQFQTMTIHPTPSVSYSDTGGRKGAETSKETNILVTAGVCGDSPKPSVRSSLFPDTRLTKHGDGWFTRVSLGQAKPGEHQLTVVCGERLRVRVKFEVLAAKSPTTPKPSPTSTPAVPVKPKGAPETGGGTTASENPAGYAIGGAVLANGLGLGGWALLRRRRATQN